MNSRERVRAALDFKKPDRIPRDLWVLPYISLFKKEEHENMLRKYPIDFLSSQATPGLDVKTIKNFATAGKYTDDWGSIWNLGEPGVIGEVVKPFLEDWSNLKKLRPPYSIIKDRDPGYINSSYENTEKFVLSDVTARPFERMQFLRGTQNLFIDIGLDLLEFHRLLRLVHEYYLTDIEFWCRSSVDGIFIMDDWGTNNSLLIKPEIWRKIFKPLYKDYCEMIHSTGKYVFMHSDGNIEEIYSDLVEIGIDAMNSQLFTMDIEDIGRKYKGKITFWGEIDRQKTLPFGNPDSVRRDVKRIINALYNESGGVIAQCEWGKNNPSENIEAVFEAWAER